MLTFQRNNAHKALVIYIFVHLLGNQFFLNFVKRKMYFLKQLSFVLFQRCEQSNPCQQHCTDTGIAIECSCLNGFQLHSDNKSCMGNYYW